ncbi:SDR family oxidoreductase [Sphingobium sp. H39-3-25]|uniref:SDR family oxidoreductase n=1 Tax=Sphingobium arseniciresistens TaxID=3030834 RepID=UPI0023B9A62C|nr:SDR family oxidoreductase [Sphingobium arseniciresistens]
MDMLASKTVLLTGGGSGLGRAIVDRFLREGASVTVLEKSSLHADRLRADYPDKSIEVVVGDASSADDNCLAVERACSRFGGLDVFVGNAGLYDNRARLEDVAPAQLEAAFSELFRVNVQGYLLGARASLDALRARRGSMIFTASVSSTTAGYGGILYVTSKHAIAGLVRQLAWELAPLVRVNAVAPGYVPTTLRGLESLHQERATTGPSPDRLPLGEIASAEDHTDFYVLLASDAGRLATGSILAVDGGLSVVGPAFNGWSKS